jgi:hypothetical protein
VVFLSRVRTTLVVHGKITHYAVFISAVFTDVSVCKQMDYQMLQKNIQIVLVQESLKYKVTHTHTHPDARHLYSEFDVHMAHA